MIGYSIMKYQVNLFSKSYCTYCKKAIKILKQYDNVQLTVIQLDTLIDGEEIHNQIKKQTRHYTVPAIFIADTFIGGYDILLYLHNRQELLSILNQK